MTLQQSLLELCLQQGKHKRFWIAYSGGLDSHVLLALAKELQQAHDLQFSLIHVNHQLSPHAASWAAHCKEMAAKANFPFHEHVIDLSTVSGESLEAAARQKRYAAFKHHIVSDNDVLLTAHHQNDQAETFLLQLMRGAGVKGLAAMPVVKKFAQGWHGRPLLSFSREMLRDYAVQQQLQWIEDESNQSLQFARNYLRHHIMPALRKYWPNADMTIARSAMHCAEMHSLQEDLLTTLYDDMRGKAPGTLSVSKLRRLESNQQRAVLRLWLNKQGFRLPNMKKLAQMQTTMLTAAIDRFPLVEWQGVQVRRFRDDLHAMTPLPMHDSSQCYTWEPSAMQLKISGIATLSIATKLPMALAVSFRRGGEVLHIPGRGRLKLKNLFNECQIPPWLRDRVPLIYQDGRLIGVAGYFCTLPITCEFDT